MQGDISSGPEPAKSAPTNTHTRQTKTPDTSSFITPEQMAALDSVEQLPDTPIPDNEPKPTDKQGWRAKLAASWNSHKREWLIGGATIVLGGALIAVVVVKITSKPVAQAEKPAVVAKKVVPPKPTTVASTLSGLQVDPTVNQRPVTGVMVENSLQARPQSGLSQAGVVFEAIAEGGITRFLALYQDTAPDDIGPIRSARPYYAQWLLGFDGAYAHVGGSPEALANIRAWGVKDLDQFANGGSYHRISSRDAPHNVYTSIAALNQLEAAKGYTTSTFKGFDRKKESPAKTPSAKAIDMRLSGPLYNTHYDYNAASNSYGRSEGGAPHVDAATNAQLNPKVVVALIMPYGLEADGYHSSYSTLGSGQAYIFQDGTVTVGNWTKPDNATQFSFTDAAGKPIKLNPGQTWVTALRATSEVNYTP